MDDDDPSVFDRTVEWAVDHGVETATFHILTPSPGTGLYQRMAAEGRLLHSDWDLYDTRHTVFRPVRMTPDQLEEGVLARLPGLLPVGQHLPRRGVEGDRVGRARHVAYSAGWRKFERVWDGVIRARRLAHALPALEGVLSGLGRVRPDPAPAPPAPPAADDKLLQLSATRGRLVRPVAL